MNKDDIAIYKSVQKNTEMAMKAIETIEPKVYENELALLLEKTNRQYADIHEKAVSGLQEAKIEPKKAGGLEQMMLVGGITGNTLFNTSTSHIAELMIKGSNMGILDLTKTLNHNPNGEEKSMELANELMHMENRNLEEYKKYL
ncbi:MAG: hypothetical protein ACI4DN_05805 [Lachnospiraceae bacterium]